MVASSRTVADRLSSRKKRTVVVDTQASFTVDAGYEAVNDYVCGSMTAMNVWLAQPSVMAALHVTKQTVGMKYTKTADNLLPLYKQLMSSYQMLIYSGDVDGEPPSSSPLHSCLLYVKWIG